MENVHDERVVTGIVPVCWPVTYGSLSSRHFLSKGMILDVTASGFHVAGTMAVEVGMRLHLWGGPPAKPGLFDMRVTVVWVKEHEFGLDFQSLGLDGQQWLTEFLAKARRQPLGEVRCAATEAARSKSAA